MAFILYFLYSFFQRKQVRNAIICHFRVLKFKEFIVTSIFFPLTTEKAPRLSYPVTRIKDLQGYGHQGDVGAWGDQNVWEGKPGKVNPLERLLAVQA